MLTQAVIVGKKHVDRVKQVSLTEGMKTT